MSTTFDPVFHATLPLDDVLADSYEYQGYLEERAFQEEARRLEREKMARIEPHLDNAIETIEWMRYSDAARRAASAANALLRGRFAHFDHRGRAHDRIGYDTVFSLPCGEDITVRDAQIALELGTRRRSGRLDEAKALEYVLAKRNRH